MTLQKLFAWIGHADLRARDAGTAEGPVLRTLENGDYGEVILLSSYTDPAMRTAAVEYGEWIRQKTNASVRVIEKQLKNPTDYGGIYESVTEVLAEHWSEQYCAYQVSAGTPAMTAIWVIVAKTLFPARLLQSSKEAGVEEIAFPFDLSADYIPLRAVQQAAATAVPLDPSFDDIIHGSEVMRSLIRDAATYAKIDLDVLIEGPTGSGKELMARAIFRASRRTGKAFIPVNCAAFPADLIESELFGHVRGAFTSATTARPGLFAAAHGGTLFLDEIGELPLHVQAKLNRAIAEKEIRPVGSDKSRTIDVRIVAATNRRLIEEVVAGRFREDLHSRLAVLTLTLPPLRERQGDVAVLIRHFLEKHNTALFPGHPRRLTKAARDVLVAHEWSANVRELAYVLLRCVVLSDSKDISELTVRRTLNVRRDTESLLDQPLGEDFRVDEVLWKVREHYVRRAYTQSGENWAASARLLNISSETLRIWRARRKLSSPR